MNSPFCIFNSQIRINMTRNMEKIVIIILSHQVPTFWGRYVRTELFRLHNDVVGFSTRRNFHVAPLGVPLGETGCCLDGELARSSDGVPSRILSTKLVILFNISLLSLPFLSAGMYNVVSEGDLICLWFLATIGLGCGVTCLIDSSNITTSWSCFLLPPVLDLTRLIGRVFNWPLPFLAFLDTCAWHLLLNLFGYHILH